MRDIETPHEHFVSLIGITPKEWREKRKNITITYGYGRTPFGEALIAHTDMRICYLAFIDNNQEAIFQRFSTFWEQANLLHDDAGAQTYLENIFIKNKKYNLLIKGTILQIDVCKTLLNLPHGTIATYQDIADFIERPRAVRAVANAIGNNPIGYLIPCHRVIAKSGAISGYRWGIERKKILIAYESTGKASAIDYRTATREDIPTLCRLLHQLFSQEAEFTPNTDKQTSALKKIIDNSEVGTIYIASKGQTIVGMVSLLNSVSTALGATVAILEDLVIDEKHRGKNIGTSLLGYALARAKENGVKRVTLLTDHDNLGAQRFYENMGFQPSTMVPFRIQL